MCLEVEKSNMYYDINRSPWEKFSKIILERREILKKTKALLESYNVSYKTNHINHEVVGIK